jgi:hypothetical protein
MLGRLKDLGHEARTLVRGYPDFVMRDLDRLTPGEIPVFVFHTIEADRFEAQLRLLKDSGFRTITAEDYLDILEGRQTATGEEILLTIDDARSSVWRYGFPLLKKYQSHAVLFVIPGWTPDGPETPRPTLDDVSAGTVSEAELAKLDPDDQTVCSWPELQAMHATGLVGMHSHTYFHRRVFADTKVIDVIAPGCVTTASDAVYSPYLTFDMRPADLPPSAFHGLPLFANRSLQEGLPYYEIPRAVQDECQAVYHQQTGQGGGTQQILPLLQQIVDRGALQPCSPDHAVDVIREDLARARAMLADRLGDPTAGLQLCLPFTLGSPATVAMARQTGSTALYWGVSDKRRVNRPGDDPFHLVRLKNDFIWRLPGPQRRSLPAIYLEKTVRRLRSINPY